MFCDRKYGSPRSHHSRWSVIMVGVSRPRPSWISDTDWGRDSYDDFCSLSGEGWSQDTEVLKERSSTLGLKQKYDDTNDKHVNVHDR